MINKSKKMNSSNKFGMILNLKKELKYILTAFHLM